MPREKHWPKVGPLSLTANGGTEGEVQVADTVGLYVKREVFLKSNTSELGGLVIKRVLSSTVIKVGLSSTDINVFSNVSAFLTADSATITAPEQSTNRIPPEDVIQAKFAREPINGDRMVLVDPLGEYYRSSNPVPTSVTSSALPSGAATEAKQDVQIAGLASIDSELDAQTALLTSIANEDFSTSAKQDTQTVELQAVNSELDAQTALLTTVNAKLNSLGQKTMAGSVPVVLASDQTPVIVTPVSTQGSGNVWGDISLSTQDVLRVVERTTYTEQTTNARRSIASSSASDASAGVGARTVKITYMDQTGAGPFTETVVLNGVTFVDTVATNICFIEKMEVVTVGSTGWNVGVLTLRAAITGGGAVVGTIAAGTANDQNNATFWAHHYVPTGKTCFLGDVVLSSTAVTTAQSSNFFFRKQDIGVANAVNLQLGPSMRVFGQSSSVLISRRSPLKVVGPARVQVVVIPDAGTTFTYRAAFDFYEQ